MGLVMLVGGRLHARSQRHRRCGGGVVKPFEALEETRRFNIEFENAKNEKRPSNGAGRKSRKPNASARKPSNDGESERRRLSRTPRSNAIGNRESS